MDNQELYLKDKIESLEQYQFYARATMPDLGSKEKNVLHMHMGIITEVGELADAYKKKFAYGKPLDLINVSEEWADVMWYIACLQHITDSFTLLPLNPINATAPTWEDLFRNDNEEMLVSVRAVNAFSYSLYGKRGFNYFLNFWMYVGDRLGIDKMQALTNNINKLHFRYKGKFDEYLAQNRDLDTERKILQTSHEVDLDKFVERVDEFKKIL